MVVENSNDVEIAEALLAIRNVLDVNAEGADRDAVLRVFLAGALELTNPGWRGDRRFIDRINEIGVEAACLGLLSRYEL